MKIFRGFLTIQDALLFRAILSDLFPGVEIPEHDYGIFEATIKECLQEEDLQPIAAIVKKVSYEETNIISIIVVLMSTNVFCVNLSRLICLIVELSRLI